MSEMDGLSISPLEGKMENLACQVMLQIERREQESSRRQATSLILSVGIFVILGFVGLVYSIGWAGIIQMKQTLVYGLVTAVIIAIFQAADHFLVRP